MKSGSRWGIGTIMKLTYLITIESLTNFLSGAFYGKLEELVFMK